MKLVILDRDGVINHDREDYVTTADECIPISGSIEAIARLSKAGFNVVIATNQSGIAKGKFELEDLEAMHEKITELVEDDGGEIAAIFYCPHHPDNNCKCRKPNPGMLDAIEAEFNTSVEGCYFIGDSLHDLQAALIKGCIPVLVKTGNGARTIAQLTVPNLQINAPVVTHEQVIVFENLATSVDYILSQSGFGEHVQP